MCFFTQEGNIPLFAAIEAGNLNVCRELLSHDVQEQIKYVKEPLQDTVLHLAARRKDNDMVKMFIDAGATVDTKNVSKRESSKTSSRTTPTALSIYPPPTISNRHQIFLILRARARPSCTLHPRMATRT